MLINISGSYGTGKTVFLVLLAKSLPNSIFYSNFHIKLDNVIDFSLSDFLKNKYSHAIILLDEAYIYLESRTSTKNINRIMSYLLFQSRKVGIDIITTEQIENTIDVRFRSLCDIQINCQHNYDRFIYTILTNNKQKTITISEENMSKYYKYYDTNERVNHFEDLQEITELTMNKEDRIETAKNLAEQIVKMYPNPTLTEIRATLTANKIKKSEWLDLVRVEIEKILPKKSKKIQKVDFNFK